ncbi:unnamed protein product [Ranitomeya imitator]|uniref:TIL domain-containing protein n=1 Tax=Ranitomeya imitator TaxID=111125 RepID=A0ABN9KMC5_9NEOB|nr:unnamed protein product [Ranitomeya imitator]
MTELEDKEQIKVTDKRNFDCTVPMVADLANRLNKPGHVICINLHNLLILQFLMLIFRFAVGTITSCMVSGDDDIVHRSQITPGPLLTLRYIRCCTCRIRHHQEPCAVHPPALLLMVIAAQSESSGCKAGEEYKDCGTACPPTCDNMGRVGVCTFNCVPGCFCKEGTVRNDKALLLMVIPAQSEDPGCKAGEEYKTCGSPCAPTCSNMGRVVACPAMCKIGCFCKDGTLRNDKGECVTKEKC